MTGQLGVCMRAAASQWAYSLHKQAMAAAQGHFAQRCWAEYSHTPRMAHQRFITRVTNRPRMKTTTVPTLNTALRKTTARLAQMHVKQRTHLGAEAGGGKGMHPMYCVLKIFTKAWMSCFGAPQPANRAMCQCQAAAPHQLAFQIQAGRSTGTKLLILRYMTETRVGLSGGI